MRIPSPSFSFCLPLKRLLAVWYKYLTFASTKLVMCTTAPVQAHPAHAKPEFRGMKI